MEVLLGKMFTKVLDVKDLARRLALIFPGIAVGIENTVAE